LQAQETIDRQLNAQRDLLEAVERSFNLAQLRYEKGVDSYLEVLDSQRNLNAAQQAFINTRMLKARNQLTLYKALGGGLLERSVADNTIAEDPAGISSPL